VAECRDAMGIHLVDEMTLRGGFDPHTDMPVDPTVPYQGQASGSTDLGSLLRPRSLTAKAEALELRAQAAT
jgi:hypothetical protein